MINDKKNFFFFTLNIFTLNILMFHVVYMLTNGSLIYQQQFDGIFMWRSMVFWGLK